MATATAQLKHYRQSPRKVRLVADLVRGKSAHEAVEILRFTTKRAAKPVRKLIESAMANARDRQLSDDLRVKTITVDEGLTLFRRQPAAQGRLNVLRKRTSHIFVELEERGQQTSQQPQSAQKTSVTT